MVTGPEVGDYLALEDTWKGAACFLFHEKGCSKVWIRDRSGTEQDGLRDGFIHNKTRETGTFSSLIYSAIEIDSVQIIRN